MSGSLAGLVEQYIWRSDIPLCRDSYSVLGSLVKGTMLQAPVLNLVGIHAASMVIEGTVTFNGSLNPSKTNWMKVQVGLIFNAERISKLNFSPLRTQPWCWKRLRTKLPRLYDSSCKARASV